MGQKVRLFAYGTLRQGFSRHDRLMSHSVQFECLGTILGALFELGSYPGAVEAAESKIVGEIFAWDDDSGILLSLLDDIEGYDPRNPAGSLFVRRMVDVSCVDGIVRCCWVYFYNRNLDSARIIPSGDYTQR